MAKVPEIVRALRMADQPAHPRSLVTASAVHFVTHTGVFDQIDFWSTAQALAKACGHAHFALT